LSAISACFWAHASGMCFAFSLIDCQRRHGNLKPAISQ